MSEVRWIDPEPARPEGETLDAAQVARWREQGYALVDGVFPAALLERAC